MVRSVGSSHALLAQALLWLLAAGVGPARAQDQDADLTNQTVAVRFGLPAYVTIDYVDRTVSFGEFAPEQDGWVVAEDTAEIRVTSNRAFQISYQLGGPLVNGDAVIPLEFSMLWHGRGEIHGVQFETDGDWATTWGAWEPATTTGQETVVQFMPGYRSGLRARARALRQGLDDPPGEYVQDPPLTIVVTCP